MVVRPVYAITPAEIAVPVHQEQSFPKLNICRPALKAAADASKTSFALSRILAVLRRRARIANVRVALKLTRPSNPSGIPKGCAAFDIVMRSESNTVMRHVWQIRVQLPGQVRQTNP